MIDDNYHDDDIDDDDAKFEVICSMLQWYLLWLKIVADIIRLYDDDDAGDSIWQWLRCNVDLHTPSVQLISQSLQSRLAQQSFAKTSAFNRRSGASEQSLLQVISLGRW